MGHESLRVRGVAVKSVADLIEDAAAPHCIQRPLDHRECLGVAGPLPIAEKKQKLMWRRKLRRRQEAAANRIESRSELAIAFSQCIFRQLAATSSAAVLFERRRNLFRRNPDFSCPFAPCLRSFRYQRHQALPSAATLLRDVTRDEERLFFGGHQNS